jgi:hypothetical protein
MKNDEEHKLQHNIAMMIYRRPQYSVPLHNIENKKV